jgi:hypothetical protein
MPHSGEEGFGLGNLKEGDYMKGCALVIILNGSSIGMGQTGFVWLQMDKWWPFCEHGNEPLTLSKKGDICD